MHSILATGDILIDRETDKRYRVVEMDGEEVTLCQMDITTLQLYSQTTKNLIQMIFDKKLVKGESDKMVFDHHALSEQAKRKYDDKKKIINEVMNIYHHNLLLLMGKIARPELKEVIQKYSIPVNSFWRMLTKYLQSGMQDFSLVDSRDMGINKGKVYEGTKKAGRKSQYFEATGLVVDDNIKQYFEEALKMYRSGREKSLTACYNRMLFLHFSKQENVNGQSVINLLPVSQMPTYRQFYYYASKQLTAKEKDAIKTSAQEQRNNKRILESDVLYEVYGPGDMVEIDACEVDVSLVSSLDKNRTIGRPVVYFMIDVYSRIILAVSVAFDNNSVLGITNLFLNLADDKQEYCHRYGMGFDNPRIWPSNIIPRRIRVDRGSEFKSKEFNRICNELGIEKQIVPGASGSLKGVVEQSFHQMHAKQNTHLEDYGLIEKRYDSRHHQEATLNIEEYTRMIINFVLTHNQEYNAKYRCTKEMIQKRVKPVPVLLWEYGIEKYGAPRPIPVKEQYLYNLMTPVKAKIDRRGISYKKLYYLPVDDPDLRMKMFQAGTKKQSIEVRMDMRDISYIYYLKNGKVVSAPLNERLTGNGEYKGLTMKQWEDYLREKAQMDAEGRVYNQNLAVYNYAVNTSIVDGAKKETMSDSKNMRPAREMEKQIVSYQDRIALRMDETSSEMEEFQEVSQIVSSEENDSGEKKEWEDFGDALEDYWENE